MSNFMNRLSMSASLRIIVGALLFSVLLAFAAPAQPVAAACGGTTPVSNETELNNAIAAFNLVGASPCTFTIQLSGNINLSASTTGIANATSGVELIIEGSGHTIDGQNIGGVRAFLIGNNTNATIQNIVITRSNNVSGGGNDTGGAITVLGGTLTVRGSTLSDNQGALGGAITSARGDVTVITSTLTNNQAIGVIGLGGAILNAGSTTQTATLTVINSTLSGNQASGRGGGIYNSSDSVVNLIDSTLSNNQATDGGGGIANATDATLTLNNTIVANSVNGDCLLTGGTINANHTLIEEGLTCVNGSNSDNLSGDPNLGPLQNNGGPTQTRALLAGSPAIDAGDTSQATDQRGQPRPFGLADDIGAFELQTCFVDRWSVSNEAELNAAIACYNTKTVVGTYPITLTQNISLTASTTTIDNSNSNVELVIVGSGFTVDGQGAFDVRPFYVQISTTVTINDLTVTGGNKIGAGIDNRGGGILNRGTLTLNRSTVISNTAETRGGGLASQSGTVEINDSTIAYNISGTPTQPGNGAGIYNENGPMTIRNSTISGNESDGLSGLGGGITNDNDLTLESVTIADNYALSGGGIYFKTVAPRILTIKNTILATNGTDDCHFETISGGATFNDLGHNLILQDSTSKPCGIDDANNNPNNNIVADPQLLPLADNGGPTLTHAFRLDSQAIDAGDSSLSTDQRGVARPQGAADDIGAFESTACGEDSWGVSRITELNAAIACFNAKTNPGIYTITILDGGFPANLSTTAIDNSNAGVSLVIEGQGATVDWNGDLFPGVRPFLIEADTTVTINDFTIAGGKVLGAEKGGGIRNLGNLTINRSTVIGNIAESNGGGISNLGVLVINDSTIALNQIQGGSGNASGGGINNEGNLTINNSTISGNTSTDDGGGISSSGTLNLDSVTVTANSAAGTVDGARGAGVMLIGFSTFTTRNSIIAGNSGAEDCQNLFSSVTDGGHNLVQTQSNCGFTNGINGTIVGQSANLGPLQNHGGPTRTHALLPGSPAINAGDTALTTDQRGEPRPAGATDDIGAYEAQVASLTIVKEANPTDNTPFDFTFANGITSTGFTLNSPLASSKMFTFLDAGVYTVTEAVTAGWALTALNCVKADATSAITTSVTNGIRVDLGTIDGVTCTFTNTKLGTVIIRKLTAPDGGSGFSFGGDLGNFTLDDTDSKTVTNVLPGTYAVTENDPQASSYELSGLSCTDSEKGGKRSTGNVASRTATIRLEPGETVICTFTNTEDDTITVEKVTVPPTTDTFDFSSDLGTFTLANGQVHDFTNVTPGTHTITETDPSGAGFALTGLSCEDSATGQIFAGDLTTRSVDLNLVAGERIHCIFTNTKLGTVIIRKLTAPDGGSGFSFGGDLGNFTLDDTDSKTVTNVLPGTYAVTENDPQASSYELSGLSCTDSEKGGKRSTGNVANRTATINLEPGETVTCTFTNAEDDTITVEKVTEPPTTDTFDFSSDLGTFTLTHGLVHDFSNVTPGTHTITETDPSGAGYAVTDISCVDSATGQTFAGDLTTRSVDLNLVAGERIHCIFTNTAQGTIIIRKATDPAGGTGYTFSQNVDSSGEFSLDGGGAKTFNTLTAGVYTVVEADRSDYDLQNIVCEDSNTAGTPSSVDTATRTATINLDPGETVTCTFTNKRSPTALEETEQPVLFGVELYLPSMQNGQ